MYGVVSVDPVSASRVPADAADASARDSAEASAACALCVRTAASTAARPCCSPVAPAEGTNHRAPSRDPAAVAVSSERRADDTESIPFVVPVVGPCPAMVVNPAGRAKVEDGFRFTLRAWKPPA